MRSITDWKAVSVTTSGEARTPERMAEMRVMFVLAF
jgi:hypothetical protein